jgi:hypothetical protein
MSHFRPDNSMLRAGKMYIYPLADTSALISEGEQSASGRYNFAASTQKKAKDPAEFRQATHANVTKKWLSCFVNSPQKKEDANTTSPAVPRADH